MIRERKNLRQPGDAEWSEPLFWYARAVGEMQKRPLKDPTSWKFFAAMHGFHAPFWTELGYLTTDEEAPASAIQGKFWNQCQHQSWYFLPWHRGYIRAFENVLRAIVLDKSGPADWALPYWNPFVPGQDQIPKEFTAQDWPGESVVGEPELNPLYVEQRFGTGIDLETTTLEGLDDHTFTNRAEFGGGFGGASTPFNHSGGTSGGLEGAPHNGVHGDVGGEGGLMSYPDTAGLDPIFWMHHVNVDRLWEVWRSESSDHVDPADSAWLDGPSGREFVMPTLDGSDPKFTPAQVSNLGPDLKYDVLTRGEPELEPAPELVQSLTFAQPSLRSILPMDAAPEPDPKLVGTNDTEIAVSGDVASTIHIAPDAWTEPREDAIAGDALTVTQTDEEPAGPHVRLFLNLENVRGTVDHAKFDVYVGIPDAEDPAAHPDLRVGTVTPFGLRRASVVNGQGGGQGLNFVFDITHQVAPMLASDPQADLPVRIVPRIDMQDDDAITIDRIKIFRQLT